MRRFDHHLTHSIFIGAILVSLLGCEGIVLSSSSEEPADVNADMGQRSDLGQVLDMHEHADLDETPDINASIDLGEPTSDMTDADDLGAPDLGGSEDLGPLPPPMDGAAIVSSGFPATATCGDSFQVEVVMENTGTSTWTRAGDHRLKVKENAEVADSNNIRLADGVNVAPGTNHTFTVAITIPPFAQAQTLSTSWQMTSADGDFGPVVQANIEISCSEPPPPVLSDVVWLHNDVSGWTETSVLQPITFQSNLICLEYDKANVWSIGYIGETEVVGNPWIFIYNRNEQRWYAATWEWLRPGQTCKFVTSVAGDHIKRSPYDAASGWTPTSGEVYYFMISGLARANQRNAMERTNLVRLVWP